MSTYSTFVYDAAPPVNQHLCWERRGELGLPNRHHDLAEPGRLSDEYRRVREGGSAQAIYAAVAAIRAQAFCEWVGEQIALAAPIAAQLDSRLRGMSSDALKRLAHSVHATEFSLFGIGRTDWRVLSVAPVCDECGASVRVRIEMREHFSGPRPHTSVKIRAWFVPVDGGTTWQPMPEHAGLRAAIEAADRAHERARAGEEKRARDCALVCAGLWAQMDQARSALAALRSSDAAEAWEAWHDSIYERRPQAEQDRLHRRAAVLSSEESREYRRRAAAVASAERRWRKACDRDQAAHERYTQRAAWPPAPPVDIIDGVRVSLAARPGRARELLVLSSTAADPAWGGRVVVL